MQRLQLFGVLFLIFIGGVEASQPESIVLDIEYNKSVPVNLKKYGVNGALLFSKHDYQSDELAEIYTNIGVFFNRFPGGTIGNYYNWKSGGFSCYKEPDERSKKRIASMNRALTNRNKTYTVQDFFNFTKRTKSDFTYVLNTMCASPSDNSKLLQFLKQHDVDLKYIELANEVYSPAYNWAFKTPNEYIKNAQENYTVIKHYYPDAKIGMVVSPISFTGKNKPGPHGQPNKSWPARQREIDRSVGETDIADALIIHLYGHPYHHKYSFFDPEGSLALYQKTLEQFNSNFDISIEYLEYLGKNKTIWITEWGITAPIEKRSEVFKKYKKSAFQGLFVASALVPITLGKTIEMANYHIISDLWNDTKTGIEISPIGEIFRLYIEAAKETDYVFNVNVQSKNNYNNISNLKEVKSLLFSSDKYNYLFIINEGDKNYTVNKFDTRNSKFGSYNVEQLNVQNEKFNRSKVIADDNDSINIKPYSVTRIKLFNPGQFNNLN